MRDKFTIIKNTQKQIGVQYYVMSAFKLAYILLCHYSNLHIHPSNGVKFSPAPRDILRDVK